MLDRPRNPYSWALLNARPTLASVKDLRGIRGDPPNPTEVAPGCPFAGRCTQEIESCGDGRPPLAPSYRRGRRERLVACVRGGVVPVLVGRNLSKSYAVRGTFGRKEQVAAVDGVSLEVLEGEVVGLVGASGAGKSTLSSMLVRLLDPDEGSVELEGRDLLAATGPELKAARRRVQLLFQDPFEALSARLTVAQAVREPLELQGLGDAEEQDRLVRTTLRAARLPADDDFLARYTHELSGGQLQRVALARALMLEPKLLVADEPVSMLDPSEQAKVLQLLKQLQVERGMAMVLVSHDLASVLRVADRVLVMDGGRVVEEGTGSALLVNPRHPATRALLAAAGRDLLFELGTTGLDGSEDGDRMMGNDARRRWSRLAAILAVRCWCRSAAASRQRRQEGPVRGPDHPPGERRPLRLSGGDYGYPSPFAYLRGAGLIMCQLRLRHAALAGLDRRPDPLAGQGVVPLPRRSGVALHPAGQRQVAGRPARHRRGREVQLRLRDHRRGGEREPAGARASTSKRSSSSRPPSSWSASTSPRPSSKRTSPCGSSSFPSTSGRR